MPLPLTPLVASLPSTVPFTAPEALERRSGRPIALRLGANESYLGPSPAARRALLEETARIGWYGDPDCFALRERLAAVHGVTPAEIVVGAGIDDVLGLIIRCVLAPGETAVGSFGSYPTFGYHVAGYGGRLATVPFRDDAHDLAGLAERARATGARLVYVANPDNPTGGVFPGAAAAALGAGLAEDCVLLLDEAYSDFAPPHALADVPTGERSIIRLRTFSKAHGLAGARIGYAIAHASFVEAFEKVRLHFGVPRPAQAAALASLGDRAFIAEVVAEIARGREEIAALGREIGMPALSSHTNFVALDAGSAARSEAIVARLAAEDCFIRRPIAPPLDRLIRVTVGSPGERAAFAALMRRLHASGELGPA